MQRQRRDQVVVLVVRVGNGSEVVSPGCSSTLHGHGGGGAEMREITV